MHSQYISFQFVSLKSILGNFLKQTRMIWDDNQQKISVTIIYNRGRNRSCISDADFPI